MCGKKSISYFLKWMVTCAFVMSLMLFANSAGAADELVPTASDNLNVGLKSVSELVATSDGYMRVFYDTSYVGIEYYDDAFNLLSKKKIDMELSIWGGFYAGSDAYYLVEGQNNTAEDSTAEVIRVIKYDMNWKRQGAATITGNTELFGGEVRYPFDAGCVEMTEQGDTLYVVTGHEGYVDEMYGQGHQGFLMVAVNKTTMTGKIVSCDLWHSFAQYITAKDSNLYVLEQSDGGRCTKLTKYNAEDAREISSIPVLKYGGLHTSAWAIPCYASVDGMAVSADNVLCLGTSIDQSQYDTVSSDAAHNIYLTVTPMSDFSEGATEVKWLTNYSGDGKSFLGTKITKINDNRFMISWEESGTGDTADADDSLSGSIFHYVFVDGRGEKISEEYTKAMPISDCQPIVKGSNVVYYASSANMVDFYSIDTETGGSSKRVYRVAGENAVWNIVNGVLTISGTGPISVDPEAKTRYSVSSVSGWYTYSSDDNVWKPIKNLVKKIVIRSGITSIPENAFAYFTNLEEVEIEEGLQSIGQQAFYSCGNLSKITIPSSVTSIGEDFLWTGYYWLDESHVTRAVIYAPHDSYAVRYAKEKGLGYNLSLLEAKINGLKENYEYTGKEQTPKVTVTLGDSVLTENKDYTVIYSDNKNVGTAGITIEGRQNYSDTLNAVFEITPVDVQKCTVSSIEKQTYTGIALKPAVIVKNGAATLEEGADYQITYANNKNAGTGSATITGIGNYTGSVTKTFEIVQKNAAAGKKVKVSQVRITGSSTKIARGKKIVLKATVLPATATNKAVTWTSSNKRYATVSANGIVTTKAAGAGKIVKITAKAKDGSGKKAVYTIHIMKGVVSKITLSGSKTLKAGKSMRLKTAVKATSGANKTLTFTSSNKKYATVSKYGVVKALKAGKGKTVVITAQATDGSGKKALIRIKIN